MKKLDTKHILYLILSLALLLAACERDAKELFDPNQSAERVKPEITSIDPPGLWLSGIGELTINGNNFSAVAADNLVYFDGQLATIVSATPTQIVVKTPKLVGDSLEVKVSVQGAWLYNDPFYYTLETAIEEYGGFGLEQEQLYGQAVDKDENLYVSVVSRRIDKITPDGERTKNFAPLPSIVIQANRLRVGPDGYIYAARNFARIYRVTLDGTSNEQFVNISGEREYDLDFDQNGNFYTAGNGNLLTVVYPDASFETVANYPAAFIKVVRVVGSYVYLAGTDSDGSERIWRNQINSVNDLGANELVFDATATLGSDVEIQSLAFAEDGDIYIGINATDDPIIVLHPDGSTEPLYPGLWRPEGFNSVAIYDLTWGNGNHIYAVRRASNADGTVQNVLKINMQKTGAPYWGRQ